jgi:hypothetical protein
MAVAPSTCSRIFPGAVPVLVGRAAALPTPGVGARDSGATAAYAPSAQTHLHQLGACSPPGSPR